MVRRLTELREKHSTPKGTATDLTCDIGVNMGVEGNEGKIMDMKEANIWDPAAVKTQTIKTAIEVSCMLLRIDDIVSGIKKEKDKGSKMQGGAEQPDAETVLCFCLILSIVRRFPRRIRYNKQTALTLKHTLSNALYVI